MFFRSQEIEVERQNREKYEKEYLKLNEVLEAEKNRHKQIVLFLLAERKKIIMKYVEERKRSEDLAQVQYSMFPFFPPSFFSRVIAHMLIRFSIFIMDDSLGH